MIEPSESIGQGTEPPIPIPTAIPDLPGIGDGPGSMGGPIPDSPGIGGPPPPPSPICRGSGVHPHPRFPSGVPCPGTPTVRHARRHHCRGTRGGRRMLHASGRALGGRGGSHGCPGKEAGRPNQRCQAKKKNLVVRLRGTLRKWGFPVLASTHIGNMGFDEMRSLQGRQRKLRRAVRRCRALARGVRAPATASPRRSSQKRQRIVIRGPECWYRGGLRMFQT